MENNKNNLVLYELDETQYTSDKLKSYLENNSFCISEKQLDQCLRYGQHLKKQHMYIGEKFELSYPTDKIVFCIDGGTNFEGKEAELNVIIKGYNDIQPASVSHSFIGGKQRWFVLELNNMNNKFETSAINDYLSKDINENTINLSRCENVKIILKNCEMRTFYQHYWQIKTYPLGTSPFYDNENDA